MIRPRGRKRRSRSAPLRIARSMSTPKPQQFANYRH